MSAPTPPAPNQTPTSAPTPVAVPLAPESTPLPAVATVKTPTKQEVAAQAEKVAEAKADYKKARKQKWYGRIRRNVAFFILCGLFAFTTLWIFATAWQQDKAGENDNWFHEVLFLVLMILSLVVFYFRLYRKSSAFQASLAKREAAEKAAEVARKKLEEEQKRQAFMGLIKDFQAAQTYEQKSSTMAKLLTVGLQSTLLRQQAVDLLCDLNLWMKEHELFLKTQNLIIWRLKSALFEKTERFPIDSATQDLSIKAISIIEAITKKHLADFAEGNTTTPLNLSQKTIPTLTLTAQNLSAGSLMLQQSVLWQSSFSETSLENLSLAGTDLQGASFWRAEINQVDFKDAKLQGAKLRTNLASATNLTPAEFFASKEWELCYLTPDQQAVMFGDTNQVPPGAKDKWDSAEPRRRKIYYSLLKKAASI